MVQECKRGGVESVGSCEDGEVRGLAPPQCDNVSVPFRFKRLRLSAKEAADAETETEDEDEDDEEGRRARWGGLYRAAGQQAERQVVRQTQSESR